MRLRQKLFPKLFIATKVWTQGKADGIRQMEESMQKLRADPIDLMQVHNLVDVDTHLDTLAEWKAKGRVRYVGVTHYTASAYDAVARYCQSANSTFGRSTIRLTSAKLSSDCCRWRGTRYSGNRQSAFCGRRFV